MGLFRRRGLDITVLTARRRGRSCWVRDGSSAGRNSRKRKWHRSGPRLADDRETCSGTDSDRSYRRFHGTTDGSSGVFSGRTSGEIRNRGSGSDSELSSMMSGHSDGRPGADRADTRVTWRNLSGTDPVGTCFLCNLLRTDDDRKIEFARELTELYRRKRLQIPDPLLVKEIHTRFERNIRQPASAGLEEEMPEWTEESIIHHMQVHDPSPVHVLDGLIKTVGGYALHLSKNGLCAAQTADQNGGPGIDNETEKSMIRVIKMYVMLLREKLRLGTADDVQFCTPSGGVHSRQAFR